MSAIAIIRMKGKFTLSPRVNKTLEYLRLNRLYTCVLMQGSDSLNGMLQTCKDVVTYGALDEEALTLLLTKRGYTKNNKKISEGKKPEEIRKLAKEVASGKPLSELAIRSVFFLAPPKGGFGERKAAAGQGGVLGKNAKIGEIIALMA